MINEDDCGAIGGIKIARGNLVFIVVVHQRISGCGSTILAFRCHVTI
jgi:hypothetical protein